MKKYLLHTFLLIGAVLLVGCNGSSPYSGKTSKAVLTKENTKHFVEQVNMSFSNALFNTSSSKKNKVLSLHKISKKVLGDTIPNMKVIDSGSRSGEISGKVSVVVEETGTYTGTVTYTYENFSDIEGQVINGKVLNYLTVNSDGVITKSIIEYQNLNIKIQSEDATLNGKVTSTPNTIGMSIVENYVVKNNKTNEMVKYENFTTRLNDQGKIIQYSGRIYDSNYGYVDISTLLPLAYNADGTRKAEGEVLLEGKASSATIKYAYDDRVRVEIDVNKDGTADAVQVYRSGNYEQELPNAAPVISITFPQAIYTNTDMTAVSVNIYDPDLDSFTTKYEWKVNDKPKGSSLVLDNTLFKKHDTLKLTVSAIDDRGSDAKSSIKEKEQEVLNSRPVLKTSFTSLALDIGDKRTLDYSVTDADNDPISILWEHYITTDFGLLVYYNPIDDCSIKINKYNSGHSSSFYELDHDEQEELLQKWCPRQILGSLVNFNFVKDKLFDAVEPGIYLHKMTVSDGEVNKTRVFSSHISKMDIIERKVNNYHKDTHDKAYNIYMKDFDKDGNKDLIYIKSVSKPYNNGSTIIVPVLVIEYRNGDTILKKEVYDINRTDLDDFYVNDVNGDGKLDILLTHTNGYPPRNKKFSVMLQNEQGGLNAEKNTDLSNYNALVLSDITGDGSDDVVMNAKDGYDDIGIQIFTEDGNKTLSTSLSNTSGHYHVKILTKDLDNNTKKDIILVNKNFNDENNTLTFTYSVMSQDVDGNFTEKIYEKVLAKNLDKGEAIADVIISDLADMKNVFIVTTTRHIFLLKIDNGTISILKKLDFMNSKSQLNTSILPPVDVNHDGKKDLIVIDSSLDADVFIGIFIQKDNLNFFIEQNYSFEEGYSTWDNPSYTLGDIDNDGKQEIFFNTGDAKLSAIYFK